MADTSIEWCDVVWNPVTGCTKVSPGCKNCYAETVADRFWATQYPEVERRYPNGSEPEPDLMVRNTRPRAFTDVMCHEDRLDQPLRWRKPRRVFVNSMSDLFHEDVPDAFIDKVFAIMGGVERHTFQVLTKRADRMQRYVNDWVRRVQEMPPRNVWLGVSVENQHFADARIPLLLQTPAAVRFISAEPLLGPVDIAFWLSDWPKERTVEQARHGGPHLDWVIAGGESGPGVRPFDLAWARSIVGQCHAAGVPVFVKQMGSNPWDRSGNVGFAPGVAELRFNIRRTLKNRKGGDPAEWPEDMRVREYPT